MNKTVKRLGMGLGTITVLLVGLVGLVFVLGGARLNATLEVEGHALSVPTDSAAVANGDRLARRLGESDPARCRRRQPRPGNHAVVELRPLLRPGHR